MKKLNDEELDRIRFRAHSPVTHKSEVQQDTMKLLIEVRNLRETMLRVIDYWNGTTTEHAMHGALMYIHKECHKALYEVMNRNDTKEALAKVKRII